MTSELARLLNISCGTPIELHPYSHSMVQGLFHGTVTPVDFLTKFSMPNSSYLDSVWCILYQFGHTNLV